MASSSSDVNELKKIEKQLKESNQRYKSLFEHNPDAVYSLDRQGNLTKTSQSLVRMLGYSKEELLNMSFHPVIHPSELDKTVKHFRKALEGQPQNFNTIGIHKNHQQVYINVTNVPIIVDNEIVGVYGIAKDITKQKIAEEKLEELAFTDQLTGLPNRDRFNHLLSLALKEAKNKENTLAVMFIDLDNFKAVNDCFGHNVGDVFLTQISTFMKNCFRKEDFISRQGGDEFFSSPRRC